MEQKKINSFIFLIIISSIFLRFPSVNAITIIHGNVMDEQGDPLRDVKIILYKNREPIVTVSSDISGKFTLYSDDIISSYIKLEKDDPSTPNLDYFPISKYLYDYDGNLFNITLESASKIIFIGEPYLIESFKLTENIKYNLYDPETNITVYHYIESPNQYLIPNNQTVDIQISCTYSTHEGSQKELSLYIPNPVPRSLGRGENITLNIAPLFMKNNYIILHNAINDVTSQVNKMERDGFYLLYELDSIEKARTLYNQSQTYMLEGNYADSYGACKLGYAEILQTSINLELLMKEAKDSVGTLLAFFAISSIFVSYTFGEKKLIKIMGSIFVFVFAIGVLYRIYPACNTIPTSEYLQQASYPLIICLCATIVIPFFLKGKERPDGSVPFKNIVLSLFYITKRNIVRRKGRFLLTLISVSLFIAGFVSLTSFSEVYGLVYVYEQEKSKTQGVLIRAPNFKEHSPVYLSMSNETEIWLKKQEEVEYVIPKYESTFGTQGFSIFHDEQYGFIDFLSYAAIDGKSRLEIDVIRRFLIDGWIGIDPELEIYVTNLNGILKEGVLPSENGVIISESFSNYWEIKLGDEINISKKVFFVEGIFWENELANLKEIDGSPYLPYCDNDDKLVFSFECIPKNVLIFHKTQAEKMRSTMVSRYSILLKNNYDELDFSKRMVLEGGFWTSSVQDDGITFLKLDNYSETKGTQLAVPWLIVVMNVVITLMNSMFERKKEIQTLSSIGVNPTQIATIFIIESTIVGFIGGGLGYLTGMSAYQVMSFLGLNIGVHQKISSSWVTASIALSAVSALTGALIAIRSSLIITPSQWRRWGFISEGDGFHEPTIIDIPVKVDHNEAETFANFMLKSLYEMHSYETPKNNKIAVEEKKIILTFSYNIIQQTLSPRTYSTFNKLIINLTGSQVTVILESKGEWDSIRVTGNLIRTMAMRWGITDKRREILDKND